MEQGFASGSPFVEGRLSCCIISEKEELGVVEDPCGNGLLNAQNKVV
jgi:hypothetical protein